MSAIICANCGRHNREGTRYCVNCRVNLGDAAPKDAQGRPIYVQAKSSLWMRIVRLLRRDQ